MTVRSPDHGFRGLLDDEDSVTAWDALLRHGRFVPAVGNSDAHHPDQTVALPHDVVLADGLRRLLLLAGFRAGRNRVAESAAVGLTFTATGPGAVAGIGDRLRAGTGDEVTFEVTVTGVPATSVRLIDQNGPQWARPVDATGAATVRWTTRPRYTNWVRAEVRRPVPTATTQDTMVALTNPIFAG